LTTSQKAALSLLLSVLLFGAFAVLAFTGLFNLIETHFYNPAIASSITRELTSNANEMDKFLSETKTRFSETLIIPAIRRSFLPNQGAEDIFERSRIYGLLAESLRGFQWVRFIDSGGSRIHFSTHTSDVQQQDRLSVSYRNYDEPGFSYELIASADNDEPKYFFDERFDRILFSFPFYDSFDVYRGTALFSLSVQAVMDRLISDERIRVGQNISVISDPKGFLSGMLSAGERVLPIQVSTIWKEGWQKTARLVSPSSGLSLALITVKTEQGFLVGRLINEEVFVFPLPMKIILLVSFFLTVYLTIFLLFNLRQDSVTIVQNRLKQLQISLIEQFYERKGDVDWARWSRELEYRRDEINVQLKQGLKIASGQNKDIDVLIDKSWDELLSVMGGRKETGIDEEKLQIILNRILAALPASSIPAIKSPQVPASAPEYPAVEEAADAEELEEAEAVEELSEEAPEELAEEVPEELEDVPEAEAVSELEDAEELEEAEAVEDIQEVEEVQAIDDEVQTIDDIEVIDEVQEVEEAEEIIEAADIEELEEVEEAGGHPEAALSVDVPVIDVVDMNLSMAAADEVVNDISSGNDLEALEELSEIDELEEAESLEEESAAPQPEYSPEQAPPSGMAEDSDDSPREPSVFMHLGSVSEIGSEIASDASGDSPAGDFPLDDFEIVSPFSTMTFNFSDTDEDLIFLEEEGLDEDDTSTPASLVEELSGGSPNPAEPHSSDDSRGIKKRVLHHVEKGKAGFGFSISKSFFNIANSEKVETLETIDNEDDGDIPLIEAADDDDVIEERGGVPYISDNAISPGVKSDQGLNKDFKELVDSVIK